MNTIKSFFKSFLRALEEHAERRAQAYMQVYNGRSDIYYSKRRM
jgi:hypothetical protein